MNISPDPWVWIAALLTVGIFSFLIKENPFYRVAEHLFVGVSNGYFIAFMWHNVAVPVLVNPLRDATAQAAEGGFSPALFNPVNEANFLLIIPMFIGFLYLARFFPKVSWLVRIPIAFYLGYYMGLSIPTILEANVLRQIRGTVLTPDSFSSWVGGLWAVVVLVGVVCTIIYFFFSREHKGALGVASKVGIVFVMVGFGASFGYTVMARIALAIGRMLFLFRDWLGIIH
jgi:hypothetical protein